MDARRWGPRLFVPALFVGASMLFYAPILLGLRTFPAGDFTDHFFPFSLFFQRSVAAGHWPVWNPYTYAGHPFLADVQAAVYYPPALLLNLLTVGIDDPAMRFYLLQAEAVLHVALGGLWMALLARDLTGSRWAGIVGGLSFAFSGYLTGYAPLQLAVLRTAIWLPLLWWLLARGWRAPGEARWWIGAGAMAAVALTAGHSQTLLYILYASTAWIVVLALAARPRLAHLGGLFVVAGVGVGLGAAQWWPSLEFAGLSVRANVAYEFVGGGFAWEDFWQIPLPRVLTHFSPLYVGVPGVVLAMTALLVAAVARNTTVLQGAQPVPWRTGVFFLTTLMVLGLWVSLGDKGGLYGLLYRFMPGWGWFRGQERAAFLVVVGLAGLAAYGAALVPAVAHGLRRRAAVSSGALLVGSVYAFGALRQLVGASAVDHGTYLVTALVTLMVGMATVLAVWLPGWSNRRAWLVGGLLFANLVWANAGVNLAEGSPAARTRPAPEAIAVREAVNATHDVAQGLPGRVYNEYRVYEDYGMVMGVEDVWGSSPLRVARYAALFDQFPLDRMWRLLGVQTVLTWRRELFGPSEILGEFAQAIDTTWLHRLPGAPQRAWVVGRVEATPDEETLRSLADHSVDLDVVAFAAEGWSAAPVVVEPGVVSPVLARRGPNRLQVSIAAPRGGFLVIAEVWMPGWRVAEATCDGVVCPRADATGRAYLEVVRTNLTLLGLWLPPGEVRFELVYDPVSVRWGLWFSGATLLLVGIAWGGATLRRRLRS